MQDDEVDKSDSSSLAKTLLAKILPLSGALVYFISLCWFEFWICWCYSLQMESKAKSKFSKLLLAYNAGPTNLLVVVAFYYIVNASMNKPFTISATEFYVFNDVLTDIFNFH